MADPITGAAATRTDREAVEEVAGMLEEMCDWVQPNGLLRVSEKQEAMIRRSASALRAQAERVAALEQERDEARVAGELAALEEQSAPALRAAYEVAMSAGGEREMRDALRRVGITRSDEHGDDGSEWCVNLAPRGAEPVGSLDDALAALLRAVENDARTARLRAADQIVQEAEARAERAEREYDNARRILAGVMDDLDAAPIPQYGDDGEPLSIADRMAALTGALRHYRAEADRLASAERAVREAGEDAERWRFVRERLFITDETLVQMTGLRSDVVRGVGFMDDWNPVWDAAIDALRASVPAAADGEVRS